MPGHWELALPNEVSLRELFHLVTIGCSGCWELTLGLNSMPSLAFVLCHSWNMLGELACEWCGRSSAIPSRKVRTRYFWAGFWEQMFQAACWDGLYQLRALTDTSGFLKQVDSLASELTSQLLTVVRGVTLQEP